MFLCRDVLSTLTFHRRIPPTFRCHVLWLTLSRCARSLCGLELCDPATVHLLLRGLATKCFLVLPMYFSPCYRHFPPWSCSCTSPQSCHYPPWSCLRGCSMWSLRTKPRFTFITDSRRTTSKFFLRNTYRVHHCRLRYHAKMVCVCAHSYFSYGERGEGRGGGGGEGRGGLRHCRCPQCRSPSCSSRSRHRSSLTWCGLWFLAPWIHRTQASQSPKLCFTLSSLRRTPCLSRRPRWRTWRCVTGTRNHYGSEDALIAWS